MNYLADTSISKLIRLIKTEIKRISENINIADGALTRAKLAQDALYSPVVFLNLNKLTHSITAADAGKTIATQTGGSTDYTVTLSAAEGSSLPIGFEIAICLYFGASLRISIENGVFISHSEHGSTNTGRVFAIAGNYKMVALKKVLNSGNTGYWLLTGEVEVVT